MLSRMFPMLANLSIVSVLFRLILCLILSGIVGMGRQSKGRPAGLRTHILVCLGATTIMMTGQYVFETFHTGDPARLGAQVVAGIGFLGAGTIMTRGEKKEVKGLTTAAGLWSTAALGLAIGIGFYEAAIIGCLAIYVVEQILKKPESKRNLASKSYAIRIYAELENTHAISQLIENLNQQSRSLTEMDVLRRGNTVNPTVILTATITSPEETAIKTILTDIGSLSFVKAVHEA